MVDVFTLKLMATYCLEGILLQCSVTILLILVLPYFHYTALKLLFETTQKVIFTHNIVYYCGDLTSASFSSISFNDNSEVTYNDNAMSRTLTSYYESSAGAICTFQKVNITFSKHSLVTFSNNTSGAIGAVALSESNVTIEHYSTVLFHNNIALYSSGGAFGCYNYSIITIKGNSNVSFNGNRANQNGGAVYSYNNSVITIEGNSHVTFNSNRANQNGGAIYSYNLCKIKFKDNSTSTFTNNTAGNNGGAVFNDHSSEMTFEENSAVNFNYNIAENGGAIYSTNSNIIFKGTSLISFYNNEARQRGGAGYFNSNHKLIMEENALVTFYNNKALEGGAVCISNNEHFMFEGKSTASFYNNLATVGGGAVIVLKDSGITLKDHVTANFTRNRAQYGGAIFLDTTVVKVNSSDDNCMNFKDNSARILGDSVYQDASGLCNSICLQNRIMGVNDTVVNTPPNVLNFYDPAKCLDMDNDEQCKYYYVQNIMLGSEIILPACVMDYYNRSVDSTQFLVQSEMHSNHFISGPTHILISCDTFEGISIMGSHSLSKPANFSVNITLNVDYNENWKQISLTLIVELSPCHPGFWHYLKSQKCKCYDSNDDIVFCSGSNSTIKRGYWFGDVAGKPTVTFCPINYCNFTCCETSNGYYHLSPVRDNQCRSHRSGTACGSCTYGYTLSFDSTECVNVESCTTGQTVLVSILTAIYWIVMVTLVFVMMYFKVDIGYLYSITYYYSIVDILLSQSLQGSSFREF